MANCEEPARQERRPYNPFVSACAIVGKSLQHIVNFVLSFGNTDSAEDRRCQDRGELLIDNQHRNSYSYEEI